MIKILKSILNMNKNDNRVDNLLTRLNNSSKSLLLLIIIIFISV